MVSKKDSGKVDQSTLASGGSEHAKLFSVATSWGYKISGVLLRLSHIDIPEIIVWTIISTCNASYVLPYRYNWYNSLDNN